MKRILSLLASVLLFAHAYAAPGTVRAVVVDASDKQPLIGAVAELTAAGGSTPVKTGMTAVGGKLTLTNIPYGKYTLRISFLGFENNAKEITVDSGEVDLGTVLMEPVSTMIDAVVLEVPAMRTSQKGDTVVYNAAAFKVAADASTEGLLAKMPGLTVSSDGTIEAQGEQIKKVFVDGKEFFGDDVSTAVKNLPAEVVENVEVFNKLSDQAEFTGLDDGEGYKALNIVTQESKRQGVFGKLYGLYGYPEYYNAGGNVNYFNGDSRLSVIGLFNNVGQQNFSFEDILGVVNNSGTSSGDGRMGRHGAGMGFMVRPEDGISTVQAVGLNYSDTWGKHDGVNVSASYFFNHTATRNRYFDETWAENDDLSSSQHDYETGASRSNNYNHRFHAKIDYKINDNHSLMFRPWLSVQTHSALEDSRTDIDSLKGDISEQIKSILSGENSHRNGYYGGLTALYRVKLGKDGRTLTVNLNGMFRNSDSRRLLTDSTYLPRYIIGAMADQIDDQNIFNRTRSYSLTGGATYTEPLNEKSQLSLEYRASYDYSDANLKTYVYDPVLEMISPELSEELSSINNSGYLTHRVGPGYRYANGKTNLSAQLMYQYSTLTNDIRFPERTDPHKSYSFNNMVYSVMANVNFDQQNSLRLHARSSTRNPSVDQLSDIPDFSNPTTLRGGNPGLSPSYTHRMHAFYVNSNVTKGRTFTVMVGGMYTDNYIGDSTVTYNASRPFLIPGTDEYLKPAQRYSRYANVGSSWYLNAGLSYGLPVRFLASNLNFNIGAMFGQTPNILNGVKFVRTESYYNGGVQLSSNISENIDFTLSYNGSYNIARGSVGGRRTDDRFFDQYASADLKWVIWKGITLTASAAYNQYRGITDNYNEKYLLCNIYIGKKLFRNQLGEISIGVNDLLDQNKSFRRTVSSESIRNSTNLAIGRYFAIQFVYNLRSFGKSGREASSGDTFRPAGPPPHGGRRPPM